MIDGQHSNAMTEVALALAMAFFSIMVLAVVSMGVGPDDSSAAAELAGARIVMEPSAAEPNAAGLPQGTILIYFRGEFLDIDLGEIDPAGIELSEPVLLAIDPSLTAAEAIALRDQVPVSAVIITTLNETWMRSLEEKFQ